MMRAGVAAFYGHDWGNELADIAVRRIFIAMKQASRRNSGLQIRRAIIGKNITVFTAPMYASRGDSRGGNAQPPDGSLIVSLGALWQLSTN